MGQWPANSNVPRSAGELDAPLSPVAELVVVPRSCVVQRVAPSLNHSDPIDLDPDDVACLQERTRLHGGTDAGRRTREDKVARLKCHGLREVLDLLPKAVDLLAGICRLPELTIDIGFQAQGMRVFDLICCDDPGAKWRMSVKGLGQAPLL